LKLPHLLKSRLWAAFYFPEKYFGAFADCAESMRFDAVRCGSMRFDAEAILIMSQQHGASILLRGHSVETD